MHVSFIVLLLYIQYQGGYCPETSMKIGGDSLNTSTWSQLIQVPLLLLPFTSKCLGLNGNYFFFPISLTSFVYS